MKQFAPNIRVRFHTTRTGVIDVSQQYLLNASLSRSVMGSAGQWDVLLPGGKVDGRSTFQDLIQPMDYVELEIARVPSAGGGRAIHMRGFVDNVRRMVGDNQRRVSINGRDFGKLLSQFQVYYLNELDPAASLNPQARLEMNFGIPVGQVSPAMFCALIFNNLVQPNLAALRALIPGVPNYPVACSVPDYFAVNGFTVQPFVGAVYNLLTMYADKPWIETFTTDSPLGPSFVYRFAPYEDYNGRPLGVPGSGQGSGTVTHTLTDNDVVSHDLGISDTEVLSYYFTYPEYFVLDRMAFKAEGIDLKSGNPYLDTAALQRYGYRPIEKSTKLIPSQVGASPDQAAQQKGDVTGMAVLLNQWLVAANRDNWRYLNGSISVGGGGGIQPGDYVDLTGMGVRAYVVGVSSSFSAEGGSCTGQLQVIRGRPLARMV